jgi:AraC-like DNA-binding protein
MKAILEKVSYRGNHSIALFGYSCPRFVGPFHYHPEIELTLILGSSGHRYVGDHIGRFAPGDLVLFGANLPHMYLGDTKSSGRAQALVLQFLPGCLGPDFFQLGELRNVQQLLKKARVGLSFFGRTRDKVAPLLVELQGRQGLDRVTGFLEILGHLGRSRERRVLASPTFSPSLALYQGERINRVCELISQKFREGVTQGEAARVARMSAPSFSRFFRRATGRTFRAFLNEVRVGHASRLLLESDRTVAEICYDSGFGNLSNFNRQFLKLRSVSPRDYRKKRTEI